MLLFKDEVRLSSSGDFVPLQLKKMPESDLRKFHPVDQSLLLDGDLNPAVCVEMQLLPNIPFWGLGGRSKLFKSRHDRGTSTHGAGSLWLQKVSIHSAANPPFCGHGDRKDFSMGRGV